MPLIKNIQQVRDAGLKISFTNNGTQLADMKAAERQFLLPILGTALLTALQATPAPDDKFSELLSVAQRAEAHLAYWMDLAVIQTTITDSGLRTFDNNNSQAAHRWEYKEVQDMLEKKGCEALEEMLELLHDNAADWGWQMPGNYNSYFVTGKDFSAYFFLFEPFRTFNQLRPVMKQVEDQYIITTIGEDLFIDLLNKATLTPLELKAFKLIKKAVAQFTIKMAIEVLPVKISNGGFTVLLTDSSDKPNGQEAQAPTSLMALTHAACEKSGNTYLEELKQLLNTSASAEVFPVYFNSSFYTAPVASQDAVNRNQNRQLFAL